MKKVFFCIAILSVFITACDDSNKDDNNLEIDQQLLEFTLVAASKNVNITSDAEWTVVSDDDWCTISPTSGNANSTIAVNVTENDTPDERQATVKLMIGNKQVQSFTVKQAGVKGQKITKVYAVYTSGTTEEIGERTEYFYDEKGRLAKHVFTNYEGDGDIEVEFLYNSSDELIKTIRSENEEILTFTFNKSGNSIQFSKVYSDKSITSYNGTITLNNAGLPVEINEIIEPTVPTYVVKTSIIYDSKNNLSEKKLYEYLEGEDPVFTDHYTYTFDNKISPFRDSNLPKWWYISFNNGLTYSSVYNNLVEQVWNIYPNSDSSRTIVWPYTYEYDGCGYPKYCFIEDGSERIQFNFVYEKW